VATIGAGWADGAWVFAGWATSAWGTPDLVVTTGAAQQYALSDLDAFLPDGAVVLPELASDLDTWLDLNMGFAESIFIGSTELAGIFDDHSTAGEFLDGPKVRLKTTDIVDNSIDQGSILTIRTRTFHVAGVRRDGTGVAVVMLTEPS